ncbi:MAG: hypothetical protein HYT12_00850 [Candidatus Liptonbacteria bacterium]|nr:hypothetical protein [Candidatus Liptonbacteria bacterium]
MTSNRLKISKNYLLVFLIVAFSAVAALMLYFSVIDYGASVGVKSGARWTDEAGLAFVVPACASSGGGGGSSLSCNGSGQCVAGGGGAACTTSADCGSGGGGGGGGTRPDLVTKSLLIVPAVPVAGDSVSFSGKVKNAGTHSSGPSQTRLRVDIGANGSWDISPANGNVTRMPTGALAVDATENETWGNLWTAVAGNHEYQICADNPSVVSELDEGNNCSKKSFTVGLAVLPECSDGIDNDGDGKVDCVPGNEDAGCFPDSNGGGGSCNSDDNNETDINPSATLFASPSFITEGQAAVLNWACDDSINGSIDNGVGVVCSSAAACDSGAPDLQVSPTVTTLYTLTCTGSDGVSTSQAKVTLQVGKIIETR